MCGHVLIFKKFPLNLTRKSLVFDVIVYYRNHRRCTSYLINSSNYLCDECSAFLIAQFYLYRGYSTNHVRYWKSSIFEGSIKSIHWYLYQTGSSQKQCAKNIGTGWFGATGKKQRTSCATCVTALFFFLNGIVDVQVHVYVGEWAIARKLWNPCEGPFLCQQAPWLQAPHLESEWPTWPAHGQLLYSQCRRIGKKIVRGVSLCQSTLLNQQMWLKFKMKDERWGVEVTTTSQKLKFGKV